MTPRRRPSGFPEPPFPVRWSGDDLQRLIQAIRGNVSGRLARCSVCGHWMRGSELGGHETCLGITRPDEPLSGPRLIGDFLASAVADLGRQRAITEAAEAKAAEAAKAALPPGPPAPPEPAPVALEPDHDAQRRITKALRNAPKCRICRKPITTSADWSGRDMGGDPTPTHFICAEAERQGVDIDDVVGLPPHQHIKGRKSRDLANVIWQTMAEHPDLEWTDWAAAVAAATKENPTT